MQPTTTITLYQAKCYFETLDRIIAQQFSSSKKHHKFVGRQFNALYTVLDFPFRLILFQKCFAVLIGAMEDHHFQDKEEDIIQLEGMHSLGILPTTINQCNNLRTVKRLVVRLSLSLSLSHTHTHTHTHTLSLSLSS